MNNECIAFIIFAILLLILYLYKEKYTSGQYNPTVGQFLSYNYDLPIVPPEYNSIVTTTIPLEHNIILFTEENFKGIAVPVRKSTNYILAEQLSPYFKTWHFKSMKIRPYSHINLYATFPISNKVQNNQHTNALEVYSIDTDPEDVLIPNIHAFIISKTDIMSSNYGKQFNSNIINTRYYLQEPNIT